MNRPHGPFPVSKAMNLTGDVVQLQRQLAMLAQHPEALKGQIEVFRQWEYAMALYAIGRWTLQPQVAASDDAASVLVMRDPLQICDVGGAGSNFWQLLTDVTSEDILLIDPAAPLTGKPDGPCTLYCGTVEEYASTYTLGQFDILTCISVIEHVDEVRKFFRACHMLLKPGGLLFLTTDYWDAEGPDTAHFHWMRKRIYNADRVRKLLQDLRELGYKSFGTSDWSYHGPQVYDYSACSLALVKKGT